MKIEKFNDEIKILKRFFELHCHDKHDNLCSHSKQITYHESIINVELELCNDCFDLIHYSFDRLEQCPHNPKPMCRVCPNPCYEKSEWKKVAKVMRYSGMQLGLLKVKKFFKKFTN